MSQENVEVVRRWNAAYNQRDFETLLGLTDPDIEFRSIFVGIESLFRGHDDFRTYFDQIDDAYDRFQVIPEAFLDAGAAVLVLTRAEWRGKESGVEGTMPLFVATWVKSYKVFHIHTYTDRTKALEAVALSEQDAHACS
jgi:ketosteroid isomerase-like protein